MPLSTDVRLPRSTIPKFADECVLCEQDEPTSYVTLMGTSTGWWSVLTLLPGRLYRVRAPACPGCAWRIYLGGWVRFCIYIALAVVLCWLIVPRLEAFLPRPLLKYATVALILALLLPYQLVEVYFPEYISVIAYDKSIDYQFRNFRLGLMFHLLNEERVLSSDISAERLEENRFLTEPALAVTKVWRGPPTARGLHDRYESGNRSEPMEDDD